MPAPIKEAHIQQAFTEYLQLDGWRPLRTDPCSDRIRGKGFGEKGMADNLYIRYSPLGMPFACVLWIEYKRKGGKAAAHQKLWHAAERQRGALTIIAGEDCEASFDGLQEWYRKSGLQRKKM